MDVSIRLERSDDEAAIRALTTRAFAEVDHSDGAEPAIVDALREAGDLVLSLVAVGDSEIVGHAAFSPLKIEGVDGEWYGLGPVSVLPEKQRRGIAKLLVKQGLSLLRDLQATGCALIGNPDVYGPMGFSCNHKLTYGGVDTRYIQFHVFQGHEPAGELTFAPAFDLDNLLD